MAGLLTKFFQSKVQEEKEKIMAESSEDEKADGNESDGSGDSNSSYIVMTKEVVENKMNLKIQEMFAKAFTKPKEINK